MRNIKDETLVDALSDSGLKNLPQIDNGEDVWVRALALVKKVDGSENYVRLVKGENGEHRIVKDYGNVARVAKIVEIYPYDFLRSGYMPVFKTQKKEERINFLEKFGFEGDFSKKTLKELDTLVINAAVQTQLLQEKR